MLKKTITFKDLDGEDVTEDFYFGLNKAELAELELSRKGGLSAYLKELIAAEEGGQIIGMFKEIIQLSVGKRSPDGRRFVKNQEVRDEFMQSNAYPDLFMELATNANAAAEFIRGIVPADAKDAIEDIPLPDNAAPQNELPAWYTEGRVPTEQEIVGAPPHLISEAFKRKSEAPSQ